jgi:hypothetical protein
MISTRAFNGARRFVSQIPLSKHAVGSFQYPRRSIMQASNKLKVAFGNDKPSFGLWQMVPGANVSRILARTGVDWVLVDCEHGNIDGEMFTALYIVFTSVVLADTPLHRRRNA